MSGWLSQYPHTPARTTNYAKGRQGYRPLWVVIHCTDTAYADNYPQNLGKYWARENTGVSVHFGVSDTQTYQYVSMDDTAFQSRNPGNLRGIGIEITGKSRWHRNEWLAHKLMLRRAAKLVGEITRAYGMKTAPALLSGANLSGRASGLTCHHDLSKNFQGTHTDPAPNFPWDVFLLEVRSALAGVSDERARVAASKAAAAASEGDALMAVTEAEFDALVKNVGRLNSQNDRADDILSGGGPSWPKSKLGREVDAMRKDLTEIKQTLAALAAKVGA